jgi:hypothetical protein
MSVGAIFPSMAKLFINLLLSVRTPNCFIFVHIKKAIIVEYMNHLNLNLALCMRKGAKVSVLALINFFWIFGAKLAFVSTWMVELLNFVMGK